MNKHIAYCCMIAIALTLTLLAPPVRPDEPQDKALAFFKGLGGQVTIASKGQVTIAFLLNLSSTKITDAGLKKLAALDNLTELKLGMTQVTEAGWRWDEFTYGCRFQGVSGVVLLFQGMAIPLFLMVLWGAGRRGVVPWWYEYHKVVPLLTEGGVLVLFGLVYRLGLG